MQQQGSIFGNFIFSVIFIAAGWLVYKHVTMPIADEAAASEQWPTVEGTITKSSIRTSKSSEGTVMYAPNINYHYEVNGIAYSNHSISTMDGSTSVQSSVKKDLKKYPKDSRVIIYYDPEMPSIAVLEPGKSFWVNLLLYGPLLFCLIGGLLLINSVKRIFKIILS